MGGGGLPGVDRQLNVLNTHKRHYPFGFEICRQLHERMDSQMVEQRMDHLSWRFSGKSRHYAIKAQHHVLSVGNVVYKWVPRDEVYDADEKCNEVLNNL